jgi:hypothetical protein
MAMDKIVDFVSVHFVSMTRLTSVSHIFFFQISEFLLVGFLVGLVCVMLAIQQRLQRNHDVPEIA